MPEFKCKNALILVVVLQRRPVCISKYILIYCITSVFQKKKNQQPKELISRSEKGLFAARLQVEKEHAPKEIKKSDCDGSVKIDLQNTKKKKIQFET